MKIHRILVPTDFSEQAHKALGYAGELAKLYRAPMTIVFVNPPPVIVPDGMVYMVPSNMTEILDAFEKDLGRLQAEARELGAPDVSTKLLNGVPWSEIVELARVGTFDLIVMGTHGRGGLQHLLLGSVAEKVVRKAPCPVLTVGPDR